MLNLIGRFRESEARLVYVRFPRMRSVLSCALAGSFARSLRGRFCACAVAWSARFAHKRARALFEAEEFKFWDCFHNGVVTNFLWFVLVPESARTKGREGKEEEKALSFLFFAHFQGSKRGGRVPPSFPS